MKLTDIISVDWSFSVAKPGAMVQGDDDIGQCVYIILTTQKGTDPLRPTFGIDLFSYIDSPINITAVNLTRELAEQINLWEPRVNVTEVKYKIEVQQITYYVTWERADGTEGITEVRYNLTQN